MKKLSLEELNRVAVEEYKSQEKIPLIVVLDDIRSMNNVGSIFRTADAFVVEKIYLCGITATPPNKEITKTALGATESVDWEYAENVAELVRHLKKEGYKTFAVEQTSNPIFLDQYQPEKGDKLAIILGNEVFGVNDQLLPIVDGALEIPQFGTKHSLNVSIAGGIVIWELFKKLQ
ncbi:RNA methyltransferase [Bacteroidales bacterium OttesenSCG-928-C03]|nr:RNA methyltransferase [Bacteroidales bacterium OttesenSCG-928-C03]MDL2326616.1 RNA methyltransferase [Bacteroidales bacterium OttesenSCG-928-A14]